MNNKDLLNLIDITVSFEGFLALNKLNLNLKKGELRAVIGPNGAGKTTFLDVITGKVKPTKGEVIEAIVSNINKMGIIGYIKVDEKYSTSDNTFDNSPLIIIVPNDMITNYDINDINIGQKLKVEILGFRIKFRN